MAKLMVVDSPLLSETHLPHKARLFTGLPNPNQAPSLLAELATAPCPFSPASADVPLALYGAGNMGRLARNFLKMVGHDFEMVIDRNARQIANDPEWSGMSLLHPADVEETARSRIRLAVSLVTSPYVPLERSLSAFGFEDIVPFYDLAESLRHLHPLSNGWFAPPLSARDQANTATVLALWDDDLSRAHHLQFLAWRRLREEWTFECAPLPNCRRFFISEVVRVLHDKEVFLDAGAHHGGVTQIFVKLMKGAFRQIIAVEPDPSSRKHLQENLQSWLPDDPRVTVYDCALAEVDGVASFHDGLDYASQLSDTGHMRVTTRPLDAFGLSPSFIKLHLEGAELAALKGAQKTLLSNRPVIATTVYHNADSIWRTPLWLMDTLPNYQFLFRVHSWCGTGAVIYAIPRERTG
jgi:FkbM family methyltransferase